VEAARQLLAEDWEDMDQGTVGGLLAMVAASDDQRVKQAVRTLVATLSQLQV
jgi:hypothetical protein